MGRGRARYNYTCYTRGWSGLRRQWESVGVRRGNLVCTNNGDVEGVAQPCVRGVGSEEKEEGLATQGSALAH